RGYTETILHENLTRQELTDFLQVIDKETGRLSALLDDLLDLAQIENEKGFVKKEPVNLKVTINEAVQIVNDLRTQKETTISKNLPAEEIIVGGNSEWLRQAVINILENSIRHGRQGGKIEVSLFKKNCTAEVTITDDGPGIADADLPFVFERFYRVDKSRSRKSGSTGLGLSIVKHIMEAHGADYSLQSTKDKGTTFTFTLPLI
ncbi:MAG: sensor histidine kinase, partial [Bacillota bacterium]